MVVYKLFGLDPFKKQKFISQTIELQFSRAVNAQLSDNKFPNKVKLSSLICCLQSQMYSNCRRNRVLCEDKKTTTGTQTFACWNSIYSLMSGDYCNKGGQGSAVSLRPVDNPFHRPWITLRTMLNWFATQKALKFIFHILYLETELCIYIYTLRVYTLKKPNW